MSVTSLDKAVYSTLLVFSSVAHTFPSLTVRHAIIVPTRSPFPEFSKSAKIRPRLTKRTIEISLAYVPQTMYWSQTENSKCSLEWHTTWTTPVGTISCMQALLRPLCITYIYGSSLPYIWQLWRYCPLINTPTLISYPTEGHLGVIFDRDHDF